METNLADVSNLYLAARARCDEIEADLKDANAECDAAEQALIDAMVTAGVTGFKTDDGVGISAIRKAQYSCPAENKDALYAALRADGMEYMFSVPAATLNKFAKDRAEQNGGTLGGAYDDLLKPFDKVGLQVRDFKKWKGGA